MTELSFACITYTNSLQFWGKGFVIGALIVVALLTLVQIIAALTKPAVNTRAADTSAVLQAIAAIIDSLSKAPTWLAMLAGGLAMMWMSVNATPKECLTLLSVAKSS